MPKITDEIKKQLNAQHEKLQPIIEKYCQIQPTIDFSYFDGFYKGLHWQTDFAMVEFLLYRDSEVLRAYRNDDSEWMEIDTGFLQENSCLERFGIRENFHAEEIEEKYIKLAFEWLEGKNG